MAIQLTPEQEQRLTAVVTAGVYQSTQDALDAALAGVEQTATHGFEGSAVELEQLLEAGLKSGEPVEVGKAFWERITAQTDAMAAERGMLG